MKDVDFQDDWWVAKVAYWAVIILGSAGLFWLKILLWPLVVHARL